MCMDQEITPIRRSGPRPNNMKLNTKKSTMDSCKKKKNKLPNHQIAYCECVSQMNSISMTRHRYAKVGREYLKTHGQACQLIPPLHIFCSSPILYDLSNILSYCQVFYSLFRAHHYDLLTPNYKSEYPRVSKQDLTHHNPIKKKIKIQTHPTNLDKLTSCPINCFF